MMWTPEAGEIEPRPWSHLVPEEVLFEYEEPLTFVSRDEAGQPLLVHNLQADRDVASYLVAATDSRILGDLKAGRLDILGGLRQARCWVAYLGAGWEVRRLWSTPFPGLPGSLLPRPGALLTPQRTARLDVGAVGTGVIEGDAGLPRPAPGIANPVSE